METSLDRGVNAVSVAFKPAVLAYLVGYLSSAGPKIVQILVQLILQKRSVPEANFKIQHVLRRAASFNQFPAFCGSTVAGSTILQIPIRHVLTRLLKRSTRSSLQSRSAQIEIATKLLAAFSGAWLGFALLNSRGGPSHLLQQASNHDRTPAAPEGAQNTTTEATDAAVSNQPDAATDTATDTSTDQDLLVGRSMDITLFASVRAIEVIVGSLWVIHRRRRMKTGSWTATKVFAGRSVDPVVFVVSCSVIMWSWFYSPDRLPHAYNSWISSAAEVDDRLIKALREARYGNFIYGKETGIAPLLGSMCEDYGWPTIWGDPAKTIPIPCEMVHMGSGPNCEKHAIARFGRAWYFAARMYLPLNILMLVRRRRVSRRQIFTTVLDASRSSAFLGAFVALFYYGVCLARTRLGPRVVDRKTITPMQWDSGLCVSAGCLLCGWSVLFEKASRRQELASFVAPRALATIFPRRYETKHQWKEQVLFALSAAIVLTAVQVKPERVRGFVGGLLYQILATSDPS